MTALAHQETPGGGASPPPQAMSAGSGAAPFAADALARAVNEALEADRILPFYQPTLALGSGAIAGFEALARWHHPELGLLEPASFVSVFELPGTGPAIGRRLLSRIGRDLAAFHRAGALIPQIGLNVSQRELAEGGYADALQNLLTQTGFAPERVTVEVRSGVALEVSDGAVTAELQRLGALGVRLALDGFGDGLASLSQLRRVPVERIKIDRRFIAGIEDDPDDAAMVAGLIGLARQLGLKTVGVGVETPAQLAFLREERCDFAQGYLLGRPMPAAAVPHFAAGVLAA